jgi:hypothetical protein
MIFKFFMNNMLKTNLTNKTVCNSISNILILKVKNIAKII